MEKESYSIDDILSEVKKHREENENQIKSDEPQSADSEEFSLNESDGDDEPKQDEAEAAEESEFELKGEDPEKDAKEEPTERELTEQEAQESESETDAEASNDAESDGDLPQNDAENAEAKSEADEETGEDSSEESDNDSIDGEEAETEAQGTKNDGMVDLLALAQDDETLYSAPEDEQAQEKVKFSKTKKGKTLISIITVLVIAIVAAGVFAFIYANNMLNKVTDDTDGEDYEMSTYYDGMDFLKEDFPTIDEVSAGEVYSYAEYLKQWYQNGDPVSSTHVLNILLIGEDTRDEEISDASRADAAIIASINIDTQEIHLTSVLRDLYVYYEIDGVGQYGKINSAASAGGMKAYINTIERYYKIAINNYAVVNFNSFPKIIDALDGVSIKITSEEINEINNHPNTYGNVTIKQTFEGTEGTMKLTGKQALAYCRIRHIDSDGARADRQKTVLNALLKKMKKSTTIDTVKMVNELVDYVYTGYSKKELISIGNTALKDGWLDYTIKTTNVPRTENSKGGQKFSASPNNWIWIADIPKDAYELQMEIYGKSNINLSENRPDYIAMGQ